MSLLRPLPGFNWLMVNWVGPDQQRSEYCSYCGDKLPTVEEDPDFVPLIQFNEISWRAEFCDHCQATWFGVRTYPKPLVPRKEAS